MLCRSQHHYLLISLSHGILSKTHSRPIVLIISGTSGDCNLPDVHEECMASATSHLSEWPALHPGTGKLSCQVRESRPLVTPNQLSSASLLCLQESECVQPHGHLLLSVGGCAIVNYRFGIEGGKFFDLFRTREQPGL